MLESYVQFGHATCYKTRHDIVSGCMQNLLELSQEQFQDLEMLRRIYLVKRANLARERKMLVHQAVRSLTHAEDTVPLPGNTRVSSCSRCSETAKKCSYPLSYKSQ